MVGRHAQKPGPFVFGALECNVVVSCIFEKRFLESILRIGTASQAHETDPPHGIACSAMARSMLASSRMLSTSPYAAALPAPAAPTMICALASSAASADAGPNAKIVASTCTVADVAVSAITAVYTPAITSGVNLASVTIAVASPEPSPIAIDPCAVLGIVAHAVAVFIHKRTVTLGGPVTCDLHGLYRTAAQRIARAFQPCGTRVSPRAIYPDVIRETPLRIQATGRRGRRGASPSARSLTGRRGAGRGYRNCRSKGHCSYQGDCRLARTVILVPSFHLAPLSTCLGRRLVLRGGFCPLHSQYDSGQRFLARDFKYF